MKLYYDLHTHSCLSPCGDEQMTPATLAGMCKLSGLDVAALTDHNTCRNCPAFLQAAEHYGLLALPGMELCTREDIHVICLFEQLEQAMDFSQYIGTLLPPIRNDPARFGPQVVLDADDRVLDEETLFLAGSADVGVYDVHSLAQRYGGVAFPAHIDRDAFSLMGVLGLWDPGLNFPVAELSPNCPPDYPSRPDLAGVAFVHDSDAHMLSQLPDARHAMEVPEATPRAVLDWLRAGAPGGV